MRGDPIDIAEAAERVLEDPATVTAREAAREELVRVLETMPLITKVNKQHALEVIRQLQTLATLKSKLVASVERGKLAARRIEEVENRPKRIKDPRWSNQ